MGLFSSKTPEQKRADARAKKQFTAARNRLERLGERQAKRGIRDETRSYLHANARTASAYKKLSKGQKARAYSWWN